MSFIFNALFYKPLYNGLVFLINFLPWWSNAGLAVVILTIFVKLVLFPLSKSQVETQLKMKHYEPELEAIKKKYENNKQEQAVKTMAFYKEKGLNPFSGFFLLLIQIPIIIALFLVFKNGLPHVDAGLLYPFIKMPEKINMIFLGLMDLSEKSFVLAFLAGITGFFQTKLAMPPLPPKKHGAEPSFKDDLARSMHIQMKYVMPGIIFFIAWGMAGAVALYWTVSNLFTIGQELVIRKNFKK